MSEQFCNPNCEIETCELCGSGCGSLIEEAKYLAARAEKAEAEVERLTRQVAGYEKGLAATKRWTEGLEKQQREDRAEVERLRGALILAADQECGYGPKRTCVDGFPRYKWCPSCLAWDALGRP